MRIVTYVSGPAGTPRIGVRVGHRVLDIESASRVDGQPLPSSLSGLLRQGRGALSRVQALAKAAQISARRYSAAMLEERAIRFLPPLTEAGRFIRIVDDSGPGREAPPQPRAIVLDTAGLAGHGTPVAGDVAADGYLAPVFVMGRQIDGGEADGALEHAWGVTLLGVAASLGPELVTMDEIEDPDDLWITCAVNGRERVRYNTGEQRLMLGEALAHVSRQQSLEPGDMVCIGSPYGRLELRSGDVVECAIEGVTTLRNVVAGRAA
jgi:hypothetical protein